MALVMNRLKTSQKPKSRNQNKTESRTALSIVPKRKEKFLISVHSISNGKPRRDFSALHLKNVLLRRRRRRQQERGKLGWHG